jgi:nitrogenase molybdenum-iron protein NifN
MVPDYSETLDEGTWDEYMPIAPGGTSLKSINSMGTALATLEFGSIFNSGKTKKTINCSSASEYLNKRFNVECLQTTMPLGIKATDKFFEIIEELSLTSTPDKYIKERERLIDAYIDGHKYIFGKRAIIYGEEDFLVGLASFLKETGIEIILALSGGESGMLKDKLEEVTGAEIDTIEGGDFESMAEIARELKPDILIGNSKGYYIARELKIPLVRVGFPIHDRMGGQRTLHIGYRGAQQLYDTIVNTIIQQKQDLSPVGYNYM